MAKRGKYETRRRPDFGNIDRAAKEVARARYLGYAGLVDLQQAEASSHIFDSVARQPGRRTLPKQERAAILQRAEDFVARFAESHQLMTIQTGEYDG